MTVQGAIVFMEQAIRDEIADHPEKSPVQALIAVSSRLSYIVGFASTVHSAMLDTSAVMRIRQAQQAYVLVYSKSIIAAIDRYTHREVDENLFISDDLFGHVLCEIMSALEQTPPKPWMAPSQYLNTKTQYILKQYFSEKYAMPVDYWNADIARIFQKFEKELLSYPGPLPLPELEAMVEECTGIDERSKTYLRAFAQTHNQHQPSLEHLSYDDESDARLLARTFWHIVNSDVAGKKLGSRDLEIFLQQNGLVTILEQLGFESEMANIPSFDPPVQNEIASYHGLTGERARQIREKMKALIANAFIQSGTHDANSSHTPSNNPSLKRATYQGISYAQLSQEKRNRAPFLDRTHLYGRRHKKRPINADIRNKIAALKKSVGKVSGRMPIVEGLNPYFRS